MGPGLLRLFVFVRFVSVEIIADQSLAKTVQFVNGEKIAYISRVFQSRQSHI